MASLQARISDLITAIGADIKALQAAVPAWVEEKRSTPYVNATTGLTDVFTGFTPTAGVNKRWEIDALLEAQSYLATNGIILQLTTPTNCVGAVKIWTPSAATTDIVSNLAVNALTAATASLVTPNLIILKAILTSASPGAGNIRIQAKSEGAQANAITVLNGSYMRWRELPY